MLQRSPAAVPVPVPSALLLAERVAAVRLPAPQWVRPRAGRPVRFGPGVVCVVADDGIHGVLARLRAGQVPARLLWVARSPRATHGDELVDEVLAAPCHPTVWDTARLGRPDLLRLAYAAQVSAGAGTVVWMSVRRRERQLVRGLTRRGVPACRAR